MRTEDKAPEPGRKTEPDIKPDLRQTTPARQVSHEQQRAADTERRQPEKAKLNQLAGRTPESRTPANQPRAKTVQQNPATPARLTDSQVKAAHKQANGGRELKPSTQAKYEQLNRSREAKGQTVEQASVGLSKAAAANHRNAAIFEARTDLKAALAERTQAVKSTGAPTTGKADQLYPSERRDKEIGAAERKATEAGNRLAELSPRSRETDQAANKAPEMERVSPGEPNRELAKERPALTHDDIRNARDFVKDFNPRDIAASTQARYDTLNDRMARTGKTPEQIAGTRQSFYAYRAAAVHTAQAETKGALADFNRAERMIEKGRALQEPKEQRTSSSLALTSRGYVLTLGGGKSDDGRSEGNQEKGREMEREGEALKADASDRIVAAVEVLEKFPPGEGNHAANAERQSAYNGPRTSENSNGKRETLDSRPPEWRDKVFEQVAPKDKNAVAALALTGARPAELSKGIKVERTSEGATFTVKGSKYDETRGAESRTISISNSELSKSSEGRHIMEKFAEGKTGTIKADGDIISGRIAQAGERAGMDERASAYDYRHAFSARNKDNPELSPQDRADALGHRSIDSQGSYGRSGQSGGSGNIS